MRISRFWILACMSVAASNLATAQLGPASKPLVEFTNSPELSPPNGYSYAAVVNSGKVVFLSGQVGLDRKGQMAGKNDFRAQSTQAFTNLKAALTSIGASFDNVVKLNYYVVGLNHGKLGALRDVRDQFVNKAHPPASTLAGVQALFREDAQIEIEAVAVVP
jgi:enamine deaminase RidA (YjgF/YER057c/UK114 family)